MPHMLPKCGHTFCSVCLCKMLITTGKIKCPFDNQIDKDIHNLDQIPVNFALKALVEREL